MSSTLHAAETRPTSLSHFLKLDWYRSDTDLNGVPNGINLCVEKALPFSYVTSCFYSFKHYGISGIARRSLKQINAHTRKDTWAMRPKSGRLSRWKFHLTETPTSLNYSTYIGQVHQQVKGTTMKWFKHYSNAKGSNALSELKAETGLIGYGRYWVLLELLCAKFDGDLDTEFTLIARDLKLELGFHRDQDLIKFLSTLSQLGIMSYRAENQKIFITTSILLELQSRDFKIARSERGETAPKKKIKIKTKDKDLEEDKDLDNILCIDLKKSKPSRPAKALPRGCIPELNGNAVVAELLNEVTESCQQAWLQAYPDSTWIVQEILKANAWIQANPKKKPKGFQKFMTNWLSNGFETYRKGIATNHKTNAQRNEDHLLDMYRRVQSGEL